MESKFSLKILLLLLASMQALCQGTFTRIPEDRNKVILIEKLGEDEYQHLIEMSQDDFDQGPDGWRKYSEDYSIVRYLIAEYMEINKLPEYETTMLTWHLGQIHAIHGNYQEAVVEMEKCISNKMGTGWNAYARGTIAFLQKDRKELQENLWILEAQYNQVNIEFLDKFMKYFDSTYAFAYFAPE